MSTAGYKNINLTSLINSMSYLWIPGNDSMFIGCNKLPPAHFMSINKNLDISLKELKMNGQTRLNNLLGEEYFQINLSIKSISVLIPPKSGFILH